VCGLDAVFLTSVEVPSLPPSGRAPSAHASRQWCSALGGGRALVYAPRVLALLVLACSDPRPLPELDPPPEPTLVIPESALDDLDETGRRELVRVFESSATGIRLERAGVTRAEGDVLLAPSSIGATTAFRAVGADAWADVYYFADRDAVRTGGDALRAAVAAESPGDGVVSNGPFVVRVRSARTGEIVQSVAGEE
jgi:hypothetical protein